MSARLNLIVLRSPDIARAATFYQTFGLAFSRHAHGQGPEHYAAEHDGFVFEIYPASAKSQPAAGIRLGFRVDSVDLTAAALAALGAEIITPPTDSEWGRRAVLRDFDRHPVDLTAEK